MTNLIRSPFGGILAPVSPSCWGVLGVKAYRSLAALPEPADLAVIANPAAEVPGVLAECAAAGVKGAVVLSADPRECGPEGDVFTEENLRVTYGGRQRLLTEVGEAVRRVESGAEAP